MDTNLDTTANYTLAYFGLLLMLLTLVVQSVIAASIKAKQPGAIPGKMPAELSHDSLVFRAQRTFMNSLENTPAMALSGLLAINVGAHAVLTGALLLIYALARIIHMILYYKIATEQNPSPRSYFYLLGLIANLMILGLIAVALL
ncbi:putative MAPEG superfamily protein [Alteromonadaceae bacterium 2753L.S.0a.02]|nr:putative MAPEG superfamily protein [Alteromonadaceae bacterium 2753L.S.0a.02]